ncbi:hypothetical protein J6590_103328, partial [Homalodisca vitripennis]
MYAWLTRSDQPAFESPPDTQVAAGYSAQPTSTTSTTGGLVTEQSPGQPASLPRVRLEIGRRSFSYFGPKLYNDLPGSLKSTQST